MKSVNRVIILGNVGKDPDIRTIQSNKVIANLSVATSERFKAQSGEWEDRSEWHNLIAFGRTAEIIRDYVKKGSKIYIEGSLQTQSWEDKQTGTKKYKTVIIVRELVLLTGAEQKQETRSQKATYSNLKETYGQGPEEDDAIPF